jgi:hypothetical protein
VKCVKKNEEDGLTRENPPYFIYSTQNMKHLPNINPSTGPIKKKVRFEGFRMQMAFGVQLYLKKLRLLVLLMKIIFSSSLNSFILCSPKIKPTIMATEHYLRELSTYMIIQQGVISQHCIRENLDIHQAMAP